MSTTFMHARIILGSTTNAGEIIAEGEIPIPVEITATGLTGTPCGVRKPTIDLHINSARARAAVSQWLHQVADELVKEHTA